MRLTIDEAHEPAKFSGPPWNRQRRHPQVLRKLEKYEICKAANIADPEYLVQILAKVDGQTHMLCSPWIKRIYLAANWLAHKVAMQELRRQFRPFCRSTTEYYT